MQTFWIISAGVFGLLVGSFLNVVIYRLPQMLMAGWRNECKEFLTEDSGLTFDEDNKNGSDQEANTIEGKSFNLAFPRSHCPSCKQLIPGWCNIPVISYLILKGKCLRCKTHISGRYPAIELLTGLVTAYAIYAFGLGYPAAAFIGFSWALICLTFIDIDHQLLPDNITLPLLWLGLGLNSFGMFTDLHSAVLGAIFGYLSLWSVYWAFKLLTGKEGMGYGDFKLLAALGAWMGWQQLPTIIILSSFVGAIIGIASIVLSGKDKNKPIPFGPYLAIAGWIAFLWGDTIQASYLNFLGS